jgi:cell division protein FtsX
LIMSTQSQVDEKRAPVFGIASLAAPFIAIGLWYALSSAMLSLSSALILIVLGFASAIVACARKEAYRPLSRLGLVLNGGGFLYVVLGLFL